MPYDLDHAFRSRSGDEPWTPDDNSLEPFEVRPDDFDLSGPGGWDFGFGDPPLSSSPGNEPDYGSPGDGGNPYGETPEEAAEKKPLALDKFVVKPEPLKPKPFDPPPEIPIPFFPPPPIDYNYPIVLPPYVVNEDPLPPPPEPEIPPPPQITVPPLVLTLDLPDVTVPKSDKPFPPPPKPKDPPEQKPPGAKPTPNNPPPNPRPTRPPASHPGTTHNPAPTGTGGVTAQEILWAALILAAAYWANEETKNS